MNEVVETFNSYMDSAIALAKKNRKLAEELLKEVQAMNEQLEKDLSDDDA